MLNTQEGRDYQLYKIYILGGLAIIFIYIITVVASGVFKNDRTLMIILNIPTTIWFLGILAYWWWVFLFKGRRSRENYHENHIKKRGKLSALKSWSTLFDAMMKNGGNREEIEAYDKASRRPLLAWFGLQNLLCFWVFGNFWIWTLYQDHLPANYIKSIWVPGVLILCFILLLSPLFLFRLFGADPYAYLRPIGLSIPGTPQENIPPEFREIADVTVSDGAILMSGERKGRPILIQSKGRHSITWVEERVPQFTIKSISGKMEADESSPQEIKDMIRGFPKAKRWNGIVVTGDKNGIQVERNSRGQNMWLYDLWLIEQLFKIIT